MVGCMFCAKKYIYINIRFTLELPQSESPLTVVVAIFRCVTGVLAILVMMDV